MMNYEADDVNKSFDIIQTLQSQKMLSSENQDSTQIHPHMWSQ